MSARGHSYFPIVMWFGWASIAFAEFVGDHDTFGIVCASIAMVGAIIEAAASPRRVR